MAHEPEHQAATTPAKCATCERALDSPVFCSGCGRLYPAEGLNFFELLGLQPTYDLDTGQLRAQYYRLTWAVHPDRVAGAGEQEHLSLRVAAKINQAFRVLLDPVLRAEYLLELFGGKAAVDDKNVPPEVLTEALELREELEAAAGDETARHQLRRRVQERFDAVLDEVSALARALPGDEATRQTLRAKLNAIRYYRKLLELTGAGAAA